MSEERSAKIYAFINRSELAKTDLFFLPTGTRFIEHFEDVQDEEGPRRLYYCTGNSQLAFDVSRKWLSANHSTIEIIWNWEIYHDFSYAMLNLVQTAHFTDFRRRGNTGHLTLSSDANPYEGIRPEERALIVHELLQETVSENVGLPIDTFKQLIWRYKYLLNQIENLSLRATKAEQLLKVSNQRADNLKEELETIARATEEARPTTDLARMEDTTDTDEKKEIENLKERYDALARSRLGSLTLKYWKLRKRIK